MEVQEQIKSLFKTLGIEEQGVILKELYSVKMEHNTQLNSAEARECPYCSSGLLVNNMKESPNGNFGIGICTESFAPYLLANKGTENPIIHISLNPDPKDKVNDEQFSEIAQEYMQKLVYGNQPFIVSKHEDIDRHHLHIVSIKVDETGKMIRDNFQQRLSMRICRELEKNHSLIPANEKQKTEGYALKKVDFKKGNIKQQIANVVRPVFRSWHFQTFNE